MTGPEGALLDQQDEAAHYPDAVLILLPPSEGKTAPRRGRPLDLDALSFPTLTAARREVLGALVDLCRTDPAGALRALGLGAGQAGLVAANVALPGSPTARADRVYSGVLYDALALGDLPPEARRRTASRLAVVSALFGLLRPTDRIPAYRLSAGVTLPGVGPVASVWRAHLGAAVRDALGRGLLVDLRSTGYAGFWRPEADLASRVVGVRVLHEMDGKRSIVSHFNKATKGRLVRDLLVDGDRPRSPEALAGSLERLGWEVELHTAAGQRSSGARLDVVVSEV